MKEYFPYLAIYGIKILWSESYIQLDLASLKLKHIQYIYIYIYIHIYMCIY